MSIMSVLQRTAFGVLTTRAGVILGADVFGEPTPTGRALDSRLTLFECVGDDMDHAMGLARARLVSDEFAWVGPITEGSRGPCRTGSPEPPRTTCAEPLTVAAERYATVLRSVRLEPGLACDALVEDATARLKQAAVKYAEPLRDAEVQQLRAALKAIANDLGLSIDAADKAREHLWSATMAALGPEFVE